MRIFAPHKVIKEKTAVRDDTTQKWGVIYNPKAGTRKVQKRWKEIKAYMDRRGVAYDYV